jgi:hypothetical protein
LAQWIGFLTIAGFALYGVVTLGSGRAWAVGNAATSAITIPSTFNYQGFLRDPQGNAITGTRKIKISLWTAVTAGTELYTETFTGVSVRDGLFNVVMGSTQNMSPSYFQNVVPLFVGVSVDDGAELIPRQRIHPVPWALLSTSAQNATTAGTATTLVPGATVTNLRNNGPLSLNSATNFLDTASDSTVNGIRFWANDGYAWIGNNQNLMTLSPTKGNNINNGLNINGGVSVNNLRPVLIKRWENVAYPANGILATGINTSDYYCTMGGWAALYDVNEIGTGRWSRWLYTDNGQWMLEFFTRTDGATSSLYVEVVCFRTGMYTTLSGAARDGSERAETDSAPAPAPSGQE